MVLDIIIACLLLIAIIIGFIRGFIKSVAVVVGMILGIYFAAQKYLVLEKYLFKSPQTSPTHHIIAFLIIFLIVFLLIYLLGLLLRKIVQVIMLGWLDKILGGVFGLIKGVILIWLILTVVYTFFPNTQKVINKSMLATKILQLNMRITKLQIKPSSPARMKKSVSNYRFPRFMPS